MRLELIIPEILWGVLLPAVVAGIILLIWGGRGPAAAAAAGVAVGHASGVIALWGWPPFPPIDAGDWIFWCALATAGAAPMPLPPRFRRLLDAAIAVGFTLLLLWPVLRNHGSVPFGIAAVAGWSAAVLAFWWPLERLSSEAGARFASVALWAAAAVMSMTLLQAYTGKLGQQAGMLAATLGAAAVLAWIGERVRLGRGSLGPCAVIFTGLLLFGIHYARLHWAAAILLGLAPAAAFAGRAIAARCRPGTAAALVGIALEVLLLAGAFGIQIATSAPAYEEY